MFMKVKFAAKVLGDTTKEGEYQGKAYVSRKLLVFQTGDKDTFEVKVPVGKKYELEKTYEFEGEARAFRRGEGAVLTVTVKE